MKLKALLVDDEYPARGELKALLEEIDETEVIGDYEDGDEALGIIRRSRVDVVFLDIEMGNRDGLSLAAEILKIPEPPKVVFTTGYSEYAVKAFELNAVDYLIKPYSKKRLLQALQKIKQNKITQGSNLEKTMDLINNSNGWGKKLLVWSSDRLVVLGLEDIFFIKAENNGKTLVCSKKGNYLSDLTLKTMEDKFAKAMFLRTHKSYIVNLQKISEVIPWFNNTYVLNLSECPEKNIPVSRHYIKVFKEAMGI